MAIDLLHSPGAVTPHSGIYRCNARGKEVTSVHPLPAVDQLLEATTFTSTSKENL